jgi:hypothetical protein
LTPHFAIATRDELWLRGRLIEQRLSHGEAFHDGETIVAADARNEALVAQCDAAMDELRRCVIPDLRMRLVAEARLDGTTSTITASLRGPSIVTNPQHLDQDLQLLWSAATPVAALTGGEAADPSHLPMLWQNGTAAVLLHEAAGHAEEHGQTPILPAWLTVENPLILRRATFRDIPLLRMTNLVARQHGAPFELPNPRIEVLLVDGGHYDPLTEVVTLRIAAADFVEGTESRRLPPFDYTRHRTAIDFLGATGDPIRYPGVICSREGQELVVGSHAPLMVTA